MISLVDYDLTRLGDREFEHLAQALAMKVLGPTVNIFGDGPDGGREATFQADGQNPLLVTSGGSRWKGYGVLQAKYKRKSESTAVDNTWVLEQLGKELRKWEERINRLDDDALRPKFMIFATNVRLSAVADIGGIDKAERAFRKYAGTMKLEGWLIWHGDVICRMLDDAPDIRRTYAGFVTPGDILHQILEHSKAGGIAKATEAIASHAIKELIREQWIRLGHSGSPSNEKRTLSEIAVDLAATVRDPNALPVNGVVRHIIERGDRLLRPSFLHQQRETETNQIRDEILKQRRIEYRRDLERRKSRKRSTTSGSADHDEPEFAMNETVDDAEIESKRKYTPPHNFVILGGPGQGKTTLSQLLCQVYRAAILQDRPTAKLGPGAEVLTPFKERLSELNLPIPEVRRWPIRIPLSKFGEALAEGQTRSVLHYIAGEISAQSPLPVTPADLHSWMGAWPWLIVFDGLDEVALPRIRDIVQAKLQELMVDAASVDADLLIVGTTRPQGYLQEFRPDQFTQLSLKTLEHVEAAKYARQLREVRHYDDPDLKEQLEKSVTLALNDPITSRLMTTPLQVTIMSLLLERRSRAPDSRFALFDSYFETIYEREVGKSGELGGLLDEFRNDIYFIHERVALLLQFRAEIAGEAEALFRNEELAQIAIGRLTREGMVEQRAVQISAKLLKAATDRLVLLVPLVQGQVGFEVRSLQEYMAARCLTNASDSIVISRMRLLAPSSFWRNTWLLATGNIFKNREHLRRGILAILDEVDAVSTLSAIIAPSGGIALDLLEDDISNRAPIFQRAILKRAMSVVESPPSPALERLASSALSLARSDEPSRQIVKSAISAALNASDLRRTCALYFLGVWAAQTGPETSWARQSLAKALTHVDGADVHRRALSEFCYVVGSVYFTKQLGRGIPPTVKAESNISPVLTSYLKDDANVGAERVVGRRLVRGWCSRAIKLNDAVVRPGTKLRRNAIVDESSIDAIQVELASLASELDVTHWAIATRLRQGVDQWYMQRPVATELEQGLIEGDQ